MRAFQDLKAQKSKAQEELRGLDTQSGQQEAKLRRLSHETFLAWQWVKEHQNEFQMQVFGPPLVECSVKDSRYADAMESLFQKTDFMAFTTQCREDFRKLQKILYTEKGYHDISIRTCSTDLSSLRNPLPNDQIRALGFQHWAKDFLVGPDPVLALLCNENRLHQTPLTIQEISDEQYSKIENSPITTWVAGRKAYQIIRRREYGPGATSTRVRSLRPARFWNDQPIDAAAKADIESKIRALDSELIKLEEKVNEDKAELSRYGGEHQEITKHKASFPLDANLSLTLTLSRLLLNKKRLKNRMPLRTTRLYR